MRSKNTLLLTTSKLFSSLIQLSQLLWVINLLPVDDSTYLLISISASFALATVLDFGMGTQIVLSGVQGDIRTVELIQRTTKLILLFGSFTLITLVMLFLPVTYDSRVLASCILLWALIERLSESNFMRIATENGVSKVAGLVVLRRLLALATFSVLTFYSLGEVSLNFAASNLLSAIIVLGFSFSKPFSLGTVSKIELQRLVGLLRPHFLNNAASQLKSFDLVFCSLFFSAPAVAALALGARLATPLQIFFGSAGTSNLLAKESQDFRFVSKLVAQATWFIPIATTLICAEPISIVFRFSIPWMDASDLVVVALVLLKYVFWGKSVVATTHLVKNGKSQRSSKINLVYTAAFYLSLLTLCLAGANELVIALTSAVVGLFLWLNLGADKGGSSWEKH